MTNSEVSKLTIENNEAAQRDNQRSQLPAH
jgi:hypothetical protein